MKSISRTPCTAASLRYFRKVSSALGLETTPPWGLDECRRCRLKCGHFWQWLRVLEDIGSGEGECAGEFIEESRRDPA